MTEDQLSETQQPSESRNRRNGPVRLLLIAGSAAAAASAAIYLLDPDRGRSRRAQLGDQIGGTLRRTQRRTERGGRWLAAQAYGVQQQIKHSGPDADPPDDDATLKQKVESILFRDPSIPKGDINIHSENRVVVLKGMAQTPDEINSIERRVRSIDGVEDVRNELHLPNMPAPAWASAAQAGD